MNHIKSWQELPLRIHKELCWDFFVVVVVVDFVAAFPFLHVGFDLVPLLFLFTSHFDLGDGKKRASWTSASGVGGVGGCDRQMATS